MCVVLLNTVNDVVQQTIIAGKELRQLVIPRFIELETGRCSDPVPSSGVTENAIDFFPTIG